MLMVDQVQGFKLPYPTSQVQSRTPFKAPPTFTRSNLPYSQALVKVKQKN